MLWFVVGVNLGLFFGGVATAVVIVPLLVAWTRCEERVTAAWCASNRRYLRTLSFDLLPAVVVTIVIALVWLDAWRQGFVTPAQWLVAAMVLLSVALAAGTLTRLLVRWRVDPTYAVALVVVAAGLWLTWPIWLADTLTGPHGAAIVDALVPAHPLFALNGLLPHLGVWSELPAAYQLMNLNQHVPYSLPDSVWPAVALHLGIATACVGIDFVCHVIGRTKRPPERTAHAE